MERSPQQRVILLLVLLVMKKTNMTTILYQKFSITLSSHVENQLMKPFVIEATEEKRKLMRHTLSYQKAIEKRQSLPALQETKAM